MVYGKFIPFLLERGYSAVLQKLQEKGLLNEHAHKAAAICVNEETMPLYSMFFDGSIESILVQMLDEHKSKEKIVWFMRENAAQLLDRSLLLHAVHAVPKALCTNEKFLADKELFQEASKACDIVLFLTPVEQDLFISIR